MCSVKFYISIGHLNKRVMHISSNEVPSQNQLAIGEVVHKLYIHTQALEFYQYGTSSTFIFQHLLNWRIQILLPNEYLSFKSIQISLAVSA